MRSLSNALVFVPHLGMRPNFSIDSKKCNLIKNSSREILTNKSTIGALLSRLHFLNERKMSFDWHWHHETGRSCPFVVYSFFFEMETGRLFRRLFILVLGYNEMIQID